MRNRSSTRGADLHPVAGLDATYSVGQQLSGVGRYSVELISALKRLLEVKLYYRPHRFLRAPSPKSLLLDSWPPRVDLFHGLNQRLPLRKRSPKASFTFHDLFVMSGDYSTGEFRDRFTKQAQHAAAHADRIIAVSEFTAGQVVEYLRYPREKISVAPHGVSLPQRVAGAEGRKAIVLTVGAVQKRKNTARLIEAFRAMPPPWELWIAGSMGYEAARMLGSLPPGVRVLGFVSEPELSRLYNEASIFAFPSLDEGFGIPVLEAMAHGLPVLTSNVSALPEVAGDAALLVDPSRTEAIAEGLRKLEDVDLRGRLSALGIARARKFTWEGAAGLTVEAIGRLSRIFVERDLESFEELGVLRVPTDLTSGFKTLGGHIGGRDTLVVFFALVEADRGLEHQKDIVASALDVADCRRDAVGIRKRLVNRVAELLHQLFEILVHCGVSHRIPLGLIDGFPRLIGMKLPAYETFLTGFYARRDPSTHILWNELIGFFFAVFALVILVSLVKGIYEFKGEQDSLFRLVLMGVAFVVMAAYGLQSYLKARKIGKS